MIRCFPLDGTEPFEVDDETKVLVLVNDPEEPGAPNLDGVPISLVAMHGGCPEGCQPVVFDRKVRIETWQERALRLEAKVRDQERIVTCAIEKADERLVLIERLQDQVERLEEALAKAMRRLGAS